ncbi:MAG TPA: branched-chain amino acid ABC transporter permease [Chloroflexota bacterium]|nr:branched-chain amino acid ABC transporter permease [Chloroflexota bacterium]
MDPVVVAQKLVFGLFVGSNYGVVAVGLTLIFGVMRVLNVAHGELLMLGGYVSFLAFNAAGIDPYVAVLLAAVCLFLVGLALNTILFQFVERLEEEQRIKNSLLISFGLALVLQNVALFAFSADERSVRAAYAGGAFTLAGVVLPYTRLLTFIVGSVVVALLYALLQRTYFGMAIRATAQDWEAAALAGINVPRTYLLTFALGSAMAGVAGALVLVTFSISPSIGLAWTLKALVVVVLAGMGSIHGAFLAGLLLGVVENLSTIWIGAEYQQLVGLLLFLAVLLFRPRGLFARAQ